MDRRSAQARLPPPNPHDGHPELTLQQVATKIDRLAQDVERVH
jgi:hypothetical protein